MQPIRPVCAWCGLALVLASMGGAAAADDEAVIAAVAISGALDESAWRAAEPATGFLQREPSEGAAPTFPTEARVAFDTSTLYIAVRAHDPEPDRVIGFLTRRDAHSASDWIHVLIDSYHDRRTAYQFSVNPAGVKKDAYWFNDENVDEGWDAVWDVTVRRDPDGWRAEFRVPFSQLRFSADNGGRVGFAVVREVARLNETTTWPLLPKSASGYVSSFGEITGLNQASAAKRLELTPYVVTQVTTEPRQEGNPLQNTPDPGTSLGLDLKYAVTPALTFVGTVNPDFGQVEADPATVNLTAFETFFEERRPFFVEGSGTYRFDLNCDGQCGLFYSRRIGRQPRGSPELPDGGYAVQPTESTVIGAGKLTGRVGRFAVGALTAVTQEERARLAIGSIRESEVVEPRTLYSVLRARREFQDQSSLGFMFTSTNRSLVESVGFLPDTAVTGGVDYDWRIGRRWNLAGYWAGSTVRGSQAAITDLQKTNVHSYQRPDADHVELDPLARSLNGHAGGVSFGKIGGLRTRMNVSVAYATPGFELNDLGFLRRADEIRQSAWLQWRFETPGTYVRSTRINFNQWSGHNFDGDRLFMGGNFNAHWTFQNFWGAGFGVNLNTRAFDDRLTRGGPGGLRNGNVNSWQYLETDERRLLAFNWSSDFSNDGNGSRSFGISPSIRVRPTPGLDAELGFGLEDYARDAQWVREVSAAGATHYVFGRLAQTTAKITTRLNYTISPTMSLQLYAQPFVSSGNYEGYKELVDPRQERYGQRYTPFAYDGSADFNYLSLRTTNVFRWEFRPGSTLFVVWQQSRERDGDPGAFQFGRDFGDVFSTPASNAILVKLAYWLNP